MDPPCGYPIVSIPGANAFLDEFLEAENSVSSVIDEQKFGAIIDAFIYLRRDLEEDRRQLRQYEVEFDVDILPNHVCLNTVRIGIHDLERWQEEVQCYLVANVPYRLEDERLRVMQSLREDMRQAKLLLETELTRVQDMETVYNYLHEQAYLVREIYIKDLKQRTADDAYGLYWQQKSLR